MVQGRYLGVEALALARYTMSCTRPKLVNMYYCSQHSANNGQLHTFHTEGLYGFTTASVLCCFPVGFLPRAHAQGVKQSVCPSVVIVVVSMKIARSRVLGIYACCKHNQSVDIGEKMVCTHFKLFKKAY